MTSDEAKMSAAFPPPTPSTPGQPRAVSGDAPGRAEPTGEGVDARPGGGEREFTVMLHRRDRWEPVGSSGTLQHVRNELADWRRDEPDAVLAVAFRNIGPWLFGDEAE